MLLLNSFLRRIILFFLCFRISRADSVKSGAIIISKNILSISPAVISSTVVLVTITPPNAETGSHARASFHASGGLLREATPQALLSVSYTHLRAHETPEHIV